MYAKAWYVPDKEASIFYGMSLIVKMPQLSLSRYGFLHMAFKIIVSGSLSPSQTLCLNMFYWMLNDSMRLIENTADI